VKSQPVKDSRLRLAVLDALLEQLPVGVVVATGRGRIVLLYENELAQRIRTSEPAKAEWPMARALLLGEAVRDEEIDVVMSDGTRRWLSVSATPIFTSPDRIDGAVVTFLDVTATKQSAAAWGPVIEAFKRL
jgi:PAS domain-containing protein